MTSTGSHFGRMGALDHLQLRPGGNKMKPTNPNADTYVEEQKQCLFRTFSSEPTCGTPWRDTLRWHSCRTPFLLDTLVRHSYLTLFSDTLTWHFLLDILVRHSYLTLFWDTLTCHFCKTPLTWHSCKTLALDTSCSTLLLDTSSGTLLLDTLTWHSSGTLFLDTS